jgi:nucleotide-binding universal stress UspA family protein
MIPRILVPLDGSSLAEQVLPYVKHLGRATRAPIVLVQVLPASPSDSEENAPAASAADRPNEAPRQQARVYLEGASTSLRRDGLQVTGVVAEGDPASAIVGEAEREPGTLIAMSCHGRSGITRWVAGSVTDQVLQATTTPLLIVRSQEPESLELNVYLTDLIVPLDGSDLAEQVLPLAVELAKELDLKVTLLRVTPQAEDYHHSPEFPPLSSFDDLAREVDEEAAGYLYQVAQRLLGQGAASVEERLLHGSPAPAITGYVREVPHSLTAMTTRGRSGIGRLVLGSVADQVVRESGSPVLLMRGKE